MNTAIETLVAKWAEPDGIPIKGFLIGADGCMCAQGQALHYIGGWSLDQLREVEQAEADRETARLLDISVAHAVLLRQVNDAHPGAPSVVFTDPAQVLGDQAETVLAFWRHLDRMTPEEWDAIVIASRDAARDAAWVASRAAAGEAAWAAAGDAAVDAAVDATNEIKGARVLRERGQPFTFLPMFGFADPEAVLAKEATR
ncbi:MAG: hypothetical protein ING31_08190 [Burkholderiales bacterium]|nr:hypothetical protein [Burkholderiales bacterium]